MLTSQVKSVSYETSLKYASGKDMPAFIVVKPIRIQHCDSAGVVFTPEYFNLFTEVLEDWWEQGVGISFKDLIFTYQRAIPLRTFNGEFLVSSRLGDLLEFHLTVQEIRSTSVNIAIAAYNSGTKRCYVNMKFVQVALNSTQVIRWPEPWREKMRAYTALPL
jgi:4-hydroxybenzoyl-CoA thioesterase